VRFSGTDRSQIYRIANPSPGTWTARVQNTSAAENRFTVIETATHNGTQLAVTVDDATIQSPDPITFHATPLFDGRNVTGATVSGQITRPDGTVATISFSDGGLGADEEGPDVIANDGIYMARMHASDYTGDGVYEIRVTAINQGQGRTYEGEPIEAAVAPRAVQINVPAFSRTAMASFEVRGKCPGDCNMNRETTIDELLTGVNLSLGSEATSRCATLDIDYSGDVTVDELIRAVIAALEGCR